MPLRPLKTMLQAAAWFAYMLQYRLAMALFIRHLCPRCSSSRNGARELLWECRTKSRLRSQHFTNCVKNAHCSSCSAFAVDEKCCETTALVRFKRWRDCERLGCVSHRKIRVAPIGVTVGQRAYTFAVDAAGSLEMYNCLNISALNMSSHGQCTNSPKAAGSRTLPDSRPRLSKYVVTTCVDHWMQTRIHVEKNCQRGRHRMRILKLCKTLTSQRTHFLWYS